MVRVKDTYHFMALTRARRWEVTGDLFSTMYPNVVNFLQPFPPPKDLTTFNNAIGCQSRSQYLGLSETMALLSVPMIASTKS